MQYFSLIRYRCWSMMTQLLLLYVLVNNNYNRIWSTLFWWVMQIYLQWFIMKNHVFTWLCQNCEHWSTSKFFLCVINLFLIYFLHSFLSLVSFKLILTNKIFRKYQSQIQLDSIIFILYLWNRQCVAKTRNNLQIITYIVQFYFINLLKFILC